MGKAEDEALAKAARGGDEAAVRAALSKGADVNYKNVVRTRPPFRCRTRGAIRTRRCGRATGDRSAAPALPPLRPALLQRADAAAPSPLGRVAAWCARRTAGRRWTLPLSKATRPSAHCFWRTERTSTRKPTCVHATQYRRRGVSALRSRARSAAARGRCSVGSVCSAKVRSRSRTRRHCRPSRAA